MEKRAPQNECLFIHFVAFNSNHVVLSGLLSAGPFSIVGWWGSNSLQVLIGFTFYIVGWWDSNPWRIPVLSFFPQLLESECAYVPVSVCMTYFTINLAIHVHSLVIQRCIRDKTRDTSPKGYDISPPLTVSTR